MAHRFEPALAEQLSGSAHERVPPTFSFWSNCCCHASHGASQSGTALPFRPNGHGMMARMPDLSRRTLLGLGASAAVGATGAYALDLLFQSRTSHAMPVATPVSKAGTEVPLAPLNL